MRGSYAGGLYRHQPITLPHSIPNVNWEAMLPAHRWYAFLYVDIPSHDMVDCPR